MKPEKKARGATTDIGDAEPMVPKATQPLKEAKRRRKMLRQVANQLQKANRGDIGGGTIKKRIRIRTRMKKGRGAKNPKEGKKRRENAATEAASVVAATRRPTALGTAQTVLGKVPPALTPRGAW